MITVAKIQNKFELSRSLIFAGIVKFLPNIDPSYTEKKERLEQSIVTQLKTKKITQPHSQRRVFIVNNNQNNSKLQWKSVDNLMADMQYSSNQFNGASPNIVIWSPLAPASSTEDCKTGLVENMRGKKVRIDGSSITPGLCKQCSTKMTLKKVHRVDSLLLDHYFLSCDRVITSFPLKTCGYHEYIKAPVIIEDRSVI